jgi:hypothetical protein
MTGTWDLRQRQQLLTGYTAAYERLEALLWAEGPGGGANVAEIANLQAYLSDLWDAYAAAVPRLPVARCPFTGTIVYHSCDDAGLDGLWWHYESPVRSDDNLPSTFLSLTGAVAITPPPEAFGFLCKPGPGVPYVLPHLLSQRPVKGVLRAFPVGRHTAYAISYFVELPDLPLVLPNTWGTSFYTCTDETGHQRWGEADEDAELRDFDLRPWLDNGQLLWIAPSDPSLTLQAGSAGCPYVGLGGERRPQYVQFGETTTW